MTAQRGDFDGPSPAAEPPQDDTGVCRCGHGRERHGITGQCRVCFAGPLCMAYRPAASAAGAVDEEGLREVLAGDLATAHGSTWDDLTETRRTCWRDDADVTLSTPTLTRLLRERDELRAKVAAVEEFARELDHHGGWDLWYANAIRAALTPATHTDGGAR